MAPIAVALVSVVTIKSRLKSGRTKTGALYKAYRRASKLVFYAYPQTNILSLHSNPEIGADR